MTFVRNHKILVLVLLAVAGFVVFNLTRELGVKRVEQTNAPSVQAVEQALQENSSGASNKKLNDNLIRRGSFVNGSKAYTGVGTVQIAQVADQPVIKFADNFKTSSGPDLQVYLSKNADAKTQGLGEFITLGELKSTQGAQVYNLPANHADYASVVVWCRAFTAVFTQAVLE